MNMNVSPPRRGFAVPRGNTELPQLEFVPRLDMSALDNAEQSQSLGKKKQKLPPLLKSPRSKIREFNQSASAKEGVDGCLVPSDDPAMEDQSNGGGRQRSGVKRVKFQRNEKGRIVVSYLGPQKKELSATETKRVWFTRNELRRCRERAQEACRRIMNVCPEYKTRLVRMLDLCHAEHKLDYDIGIAKLGLVGGLENETLEEMFAAIVSEEEGHLARGLEKRIINAMDVPFHRHRKSVQTVLAIQHCLEQQRAGRLSFERKAMLIASQYESSSRYAAIWAREIAIEDSKSAHTMFQI